MSVGTMWRIAFSLETVTVTCESFVAEHCVFCVVDRCLNGGSSSGSSLLDISCGQSQIAKCSPSAPPPSSAVTDAASTSRKKRDRFNGMSDEEVLKLTVPDQLCENLDMIIVSDSFTQ